MEFRMINKDLVRDRLLLINKYVAQLEMLSQFSKKNFSVIVGTRQQQKAF